jgi:transcriptional regulator with XRE-family HTH domain
MMAGHSAWKNRSQRLANEPEHPAYTEARWDAQLGEMVYNRRKELELSQTVVAERAGMSQGNLSRIEAGGGVPTIGVLQRLANALDTELVVEFGSHDKREEVEPVTDSTPADPVGVYQFELELAGPIDLDIATEHLHAVAERLIGHDTGGTAAFTRKATSATEAILTTIDSLERAGFRVVAAAPWTERATGAATAVEVEDIAAEVTALLRAREILRKAPSGRHDSLARLINA